ncbi:glycerophosphodiester phosphodiesterase, partial [Burkholderia gladioli]|nr:glycerophosphodiester phosphodiesterase [Burkholderia gladioli]
MTFSRTGISCLLLALVGSVALTACGGGDDPATPPARTPTALKTLDGNAPLVIGHRGLPGLYPEETQVSY